MRIRLNVNVAVMPSFAVEYGVMKATSKLTPNRNARSRHGSFTIFCGPAYLIHGAVSLDS